MKIGEVVKRSNYEIIKILVLWALRRSLNMVDGR